MLNKRAFLQRAAVAAAVGAVAPWRSVLADVGHGPRAKQPLAQSTPATRVSAGAPIGPFDVVVFNDWYPDSRAFAETFAKQHVRALAIDGDAGTLWYGTLYLLVAGGANRIVGMTTHTDLLILETLARSKGLRVRYRGGPEALVCSNGQRPRECPRVLVSWVLSC